MAVFLVVRNQQRRNHLRRNRIFRDRLNPLDTYDDIEIILRLWKRSDYVPPIGDKKNLRKSFRDMVFYRNNLSTSEEIVERFRLTRQLILELYDDIGYELEPLTRRNHAIPGMLQIFCTLRFYASGSFQAVVGDCVGIHRSSVCRIITRVTRAICRIRNRHIKFPRRRDDIRNTQERFHAIAGFPQIVGAIDGTHIFIKTPSQDEHLFVSRKGGHSLNVLATCDPDMIITYMVAKYGGATND